MANTFSSLHYHIVFSTKNRERWLVPEIESRVWEYLGGIARENGMKAVQIGGIEDHVHIVLATSTTTSPSKAVQLLKGRSSKWIHETFRSLSRFAWQDGYGIFTVSKSQLPSVIRYVQQQRQHHQSRSFQTEYETMLVQHAIEYDERYLWG